MMRAGVFLGCLMVGVVASSWPDCNGTGEADIGPFAPAAFHNITYEGKIIYALVPHGQSGPWPVLVFMHGGLGAFEQWAFPVGEKPSASTWYARPLDIYATHGFVVLFPHIKGPKADQKVTTTENNGASILKTIEFANVAQKDPESPLNGIMDLARLSVAGHSMGGNDAIKAAYKLPAGALRVLIAQHPYLCGPFGPPPSPITWMESQLHAVNQKFPVLYTTATNDGAFWPAPATAKHELGCFNGSKLSGPAVFLQFSAQACAETNRSMPWPEKGHDCSFKPNVDPPWVLRMLKLYAQRDGDLKSHCASLIWTASSGSPKDDPHVDKAVVIPPTSLAFV